MTFLPSMVSPVYTVPWSAPAWQSLGPARMPPATLDAMAVAPAVAKIMKSRRSNPFASLDTSSSRLK